MSQTVFLYNIPKYLKHKLKENDPSDPTILYKETQNPESITQTSEANKLIAYIDTLEQFENFTQKLTQTDSNTELFLILNDNIDSIKFKIELLKFKEKHNEIAIITAKKSELK